MARKNLHCLYIRGVSCRVLCGTRLRFGRLGYKYKEPLESNNARLGLITKYVFIHNASNILQTFDWGSWFI